MRVLMMSLILEHYKIFTVLKVIVWEFFLEKVGEQGREYELSGVLMVYFTFFLIF